MEKGMQKLRMLRIIIILLKVIFTRRFWFARKGVVERCVKKREAAHLQSFQERRRLRLEKYLLVPGYFWGRKLMTDLRIGSNKLEIEKGRWEEVVKEDRI